MLTSFTLILNSGELTADELKKAIVKILKRTPTDEEAEEIVNILDKDRDGRVSVIELLQFVEEKRQQSEVAALEVI